ncbi:MAG: UDP-N-acetylmuramoyl-L-alanine--D-glutamate ligase [Clostridia bacterium]|nr:UDP-N-acetylmuramoyl-L-alanine--D-glutamate ligase [Clostridia bacterium]
MSEINSYFKSLKKKKILIAGFGISNAPLVDLFQKEGISSVWVADSGGRTEKDRKRVTLKLKKLVKEGKIKGFTVGAGYLDGARGFDVVFKSPGIRFDAPGLGEAQKSGTVVTSEMEQFVKHCPCRIYAVTGSDGKTTTTTLIYKMLSSVKKDSKVYVGGNIGKPLFSLLREIRPEDTVVLELSSFQLMKMNTSGIDVAVITNISPNHLDVHRSYEEYIDAKKTIFSGGALTVLNKDNQITASMAGEVPGAVRFFSRLETPDNGTFEKEGKMYVAKDGRREFVMNASDIMIPGGHNVENYLAAMAAVSDVVPFKNILRIAKRFNGVHHRIELFLTRNGVKYYDSSIDSSPKRSIATLAVFEPKSVVMVAGGKDKNLDYSELGGPVADKVRVLVLTGPTSDKIERSVRDEMEKRGEETVKIIRAASFEDAVSLAAANARPGDNLILSPASTSFDRFRNFEERGRYFKKLARQLNADR